MSNNKVWLVTGASKGLGLTLAKKLLATGYRVAATSRTVNALVKEIGAADQQFLPLQVDLVNEQSVQQAISKIISTFGNIDVVVNNAGFGMTGALEELSDAEVRQNFDINVFGSLNVIRNVMPHLRAQRSGYIFNISSIGGFIGNFPGWGIYCATKFAVAGFTESLSAEAKAFGVHATVVYPGLFRTSFLTQDSLAVPKQAIADYEEAIASREQYQQQINGTQPGDPEKAADALIQLSQEANPPLHLFLGQDAYDIAQMKIDAVQKDREAWKQLSVSTAFEVAEPVS